MSYRNAYMMGTAAWLKEQQDNSARLQQMDAARLKGIAQAKADEASVRELSSIQSSSMWVGLRIVLIISTVILMFLYNTVFKKEKRVFWFLTLVLVMEIIFKFVQIVKEDGGLAVGHLAGA